MPNFITLLFQPTSNQQTRLAQGQVVPEANRCVQCGICSYNCPAGIDVREHAAEGTPVRDSRCLTCGECVMRCPRGVLHFEQIALARMKEGGE